ncbi:MAG: hypothetical protein R6U85_07620 [Salinivirgaceae bacterium]
MRIKHLFFVAVAAILLSSCTATHQSMREPNARVEFQKNDFEFSQQVSGTATTTRILGIDFARLFNKEKTRIEKDGTAEIIDLAAIPIIGNYVVDPTYNYALYDMMSKNSGYDVVFYPSFVKTDKKPIGLGFLYKITTVEAKAKLAKIKK